MRALTLLELQMEPRATSPDMSMIPAPVMAMTSAHTSQSRAGPSPAAPVSSRARMRRSRAPAICSGPPTQRPIHTCGAGGLGLAHRSPSSSSARRSTGTRSSARSPGVTAGTDHHRVVARRSLPAPQSGRSAAVAVALRVGSPAPDFPSDRGARLPRAAHLGAALQPNVPSRALRSYGPLRPRGRVSPRFGLQNGCKRRPDPTCCVRRSGERAQNTWSQACAGERTRTSMPCGTGT